VTSASPSYFAYSDPEETRTLTILSALAGHFCRPGVFPVHFAPVIPSYAAGKEQKEISNAG
jgi:hypothetical protein